MPTYPRRHVLLRFGGSAAEGQESWSCGVRLATIDPAVGPATLLQSCQEALENVQEACAEYVETPNARFSNLLRLEFVKLNPIDTDGRYIFPDQPVEHLFEGPDVPTGTAQAAPLQLAYCVTLRGEFRRGPAARGRYYVPCGVTGVPVVTSTGVIAEGQAQAAADAAGTFLESVQVLDLDPVGASLKLRLMGDGQSGPRESSVTRVEVGNVYDTQRRRRHQIEETYYPATTWVEP